MSVKRIIVQVVVASAALSLTSLALADDSYGTAPMAAPTSSYDNTGFIIGAQAGYADTHWNNFLNQYQPGVTVDHSGFTARGYVGYSFNTYLSAEVGYIYLPDAKVKGNGMDARIENYAVDLFVKGNVPVANGLGVYAKAGGAYLHSSPRGTALSVDTNNNLSDNSHIGPAFGVGAYYEISPQLSADISWTRYSGDSKLYNSDGSLSNHYQPNPDVVMLGFSYKMPLSIS